MTLDKHPVVIGFYGLSNSGKTTLLEMLISELSKQGFRVAAVKRTNQQVQMDQDGKDTRRFSLAGANPVVFSTPLETTLVNSSEKSENRIVEDLELAFKLDFIFIEGSKDAGIQKIRIGDHEMRENTLFTYDGNLENLLGFLKSKLSLEAKDG